MKKYLLALATLAISGSAFAAAPDCTKFNLQISYNDMNPIRDIIAGKITASTRMYSDRCEKGGQTLDVTFSGDPVDASGKRTAQVRILLKKVTPGLAFGALTDTMAKAQGQADAAALRTFLGSIYGKDKNGAVVDLTKQPWTHMEFQVAR